MATIEERVTNLRNATATLAQFYAEIEGFMGILSARMEERGYRTNAKRLRPGTLSVRNLPYRLLASATVMFVKEKDDMDDDESPDDDEDIDEAVKTGKQEVGHHIRPEGSVREPLPVCPQDDSERADAGATSVAPGCPREHAIRGQGDG